MTLQEAKKLKKGDLVLDKRSRETYPVWFTELIPKGKNYYGQNRVSVVCLLSNEPDVSYVKGIRVATARTINFCHKRLTLVNE